MTNPLASRLLKREEKMNAFTVRKDCKLADIHHAKFQTSISDLQWPVNEMILNQLLARGLSNREIAGQYGVSTKDVERLICEKGGGSACRNFSWE
jgi:DNA-binding CsgD family transcriptional regulator